MRLLRNNVLRNIMIIELYGLPGSGKSFIIEKISKNISVNYIKDSVIKRTFIKQAKKISIWMPSSIILKKEFIMSLAIFHQNHYILKEVLMYI